MLPLPAGTVTFLFTDIEGSTRLWEEQPDAMAEALADHDAILREAISSTHGVVFKTVGDAFHGVFWDAADALACAMLAQGRLLAGGLPFRTRIAIHSGEPRLRDDDYFGPPVNRVARILSAAHGGQILISSTAKLLTEERLPDGSRLIPHGVHRLKDLAEPEELFQLAHHSLPLEFPPLRSLTTHVHNLPAQLASFVGREAELKELGSTLDAGARLITLTGVGGTGKTRIALQLAADRIEQFPGGVWWVDLSSIRDPARVMPEIAEALGIAEEPSRPLIQQMSERLSRGSTLLVIDNFEQVLEAAADLAELLRAAPSVRALVTSRAALNVMGEHDFTVPEMSEDEAVALFVSRAQQVQSRFDLDSQSQAVVEIICRRLDGIPLAIELAAAQARLLTVKQIERQLNQKLRTLVSPYRDVALRQRTLRATVDWSYDLLSESERRLFTALSVFTGGFTIDAAAEVLPGEDVVAGIARLREQSLLNVDNSADVPRFRMLETLREYAQEKLGQAGDSDRVRMRHADYFSALADREDLRAGGATWERVSTELAADYDNVRDALAWLIQIGSADKANAIASSLGRFWEASGRFREARTLLRQCIEMQASIEDIVLRARVLGWAGWFADLQGEHDESDGLQTASLTLCRDARDRPGESRALNHLALTAANRRRYSEARKLYEESLAIARELKDKSAQAARLNNLGLLAIEDSRITDAVELLRESLALYQAIGEPHGIAACHCNLGELAVQTERWQDAKVYLEEALEQFSRLEDVRGVAACLGNLALVNQFSGDPVASRERATEALAICREAGMPMLVPGLLESLARAEELSGNLDAAAMALTAAQRFRHEFDLKPSDLESKMSASMHYPAPAMERARATLRLLQADEIIGAVLGLGPSPA